MADNTQLDDLGFMPDKPAASSDASLQDLGFVEDKPSAPPTPQKAYGFFDDPTPVTAPSSIYEGYKSEVSDLFGASQTPLTTLLPDSVRSVAKKATLGGAVEGAGNLIPGTAGKIVQGAGKGIEDFGESLTSPLSIALAGESFLAKAPALVQRLASGAFALQSAIGGIKEIEPLREAIKNGDWTEAAHIGTSILANAFIAGLAGTHAIKGSPAVPPPIPEGETGAAGTPPPIPPRPEPADLLKAEINKAKKSGTWSPELRAFVTGVDPVLAGTTPEKVAAFAKSVGMEYRPVPSAAAQPPPIPSRGPIITPPPPQEPNAQGIRENQGQPPQAGQVTQSGEVGSRSNLEQTPLGQPEPVAQREEIQNAPVQAQPNQEVNAIPTRPPISPAIQAQTPVTPSAAAIHPAVAPTTSPQAAPPLNPGGSLASLPPELQAKSNAVKDQMAAEFAKLKAQGSASPDLTALKKSMDEARTIRDSKPKDSNEWYDANADYVSAYNRFQAESLRQSAEVPPEKPPKSATSTVDQPVKYKIGKSPQTFSLVEKLPQSEVEKANGEQAVKVKNDKTGVVQTVAESDLTPVQDRTGETKTPKRDLDAELVAAKLDPSVFQNAAQKREALRRAKAQASRQAAVGNVAQQSTRSAVVTQVEREIDKQKNARNDEIAVGPYEVDGEVQLDSFSVSHPDEPDSWAVYKTQNGKWTGENGQGSRLPDFDSADKAIEAAKSRVREKLADQKGTFGNNLDNASMVGPLFEEFKVPDGATQTGWIHTKWGSWYNDVTLENGEKLKLSVRDHEATRKDLGLPDLTSEVSKEWTPKEVDAALTRLEGKLEKRASAASLSDIGTTTQTVNEGEAQGLEGIRSLLQQSGYPQNHIDTAMALLERVERAGVDMSQWKLKIQRDTEGGNVKGYRLGNLIVLTSIADAATFPEEVYHLGFDFLTDEEQAGIEEVRLAELRKIYGDNIPARLASGKMTSDEFLESGVPREQYPLINTSEFAAQFNSKKFANETFEGMKNPSSWYERLRDKLRHIIRTIVNFFRAEKKVRPDLRSDLDKLGHFDFTPTPESGRLFEDEIRKREASLAVNPKQYQTQEAFGERALPERTLAAYGDLSMIKNREADAIGASEQARKMVSIPNQDLLAAMASTDLAVNRFVLDNYAQMKARVAGSDPGLKWSVTQDALHAVENEKVRQARTAASFEAQSDKVNSPGFIKSVSQMLSRESAAKDAEDAMDTYKSQMAQSAGQIIRDLEAKGKTEAQYDQLRSDYQRVQKMTQFSEAVAQRVQDIIDTVSASEGGFQLLNGGMDKTGQKIYNAYVDLKESTSPGSMSNNPAGKAEARRFIDSMGDYENLSPINKQKVDAARDVIANANLPGDKKIFARLASQVLAANTGMRWEMASKAHMMVNPTFKAAVTAAGDKFRKAFEKDPGKAISQIIRLSSTLTSKAVSAEAAWIRMQKEVLPELRRYEELRQATEIDRRTAASPEYKALVKQIHDDAGAVSIPSSERERGITPQTAFNEFSGKQTVVSPTGGKYEINLGYTKASVVAAQAQMNNYLADMSQWINDPTNAHSPDLKYWKMRAEFVENAINVSSVLAPTSTSSLGAKGAWTMMDFFFKGTALPSAKLSWIAGNNFFRVFNIADQWYNGVEGEWRTRAINAMRSHKLDVNADMAVYQQQVLNRLAAEYRAGNALKAGDRLNNGMVLTPQDIALLDYQGKSISALFNQVKNSGREKVMGNNLLVDSWNKNVFALRSPQEIGARVGTTLPHEFSQQAVALARRVAQTTANTQLYTLLDQPDIFKEFVQRFFAERRADYSTLSPFEDIYKEMAEKWRNNAPDAPHDLADVINFIDARTTPEHTIATIHDAILGEMGGQLRKFYKQYVEQESAGEDVRAVRATKNSAFTQGFQRDVGSSFYYDYGAMSSPAIRSMGVDSTNFHLVRFVNSLSSALKSYDEAMAELTNARDKRAAAKAQRSDFRSGKDFRNFERLQAEKSQLQYIHDHIAEAYGSNQEDVVDLFSNMGGLLRDFTGAALTGLNTIGKVGVGSTVKMGLILQAFERAAIMSYPKAAWSTVMSAAKIFAYSPAAALSGARATRAAWSEGVGIAVARGLQESFESLFRQGKYFNQQYQLGLGFKNPVGFRIYNEILTPYSGGMGYDAKLANNLLLRWSQKGFYRLWSTGVRPPLEIVKAMFPQLAYAISYDATARAGGWSVDGIAAQARRSFEFLEKSGGLSAYDLNNPSNLKNILPVDYILPTGIFEKNQTNLNFARDWWQRALDIPLNEMVINYWKRLAATPAADRGSVSFLAADQTGADVKKYEDGRMAALMAILLKDVHHASPENRPLILRVDRTQRFLFPLVGWTTQSIRDTAYRLGVAPTNNMMKARMLAAAAALAFIAASTLGGESEKEVKKVLAAAMGEEYPVKMINEARGDKDAAKILALDSVSVIPVLHDMMASIMGENGVHSAGGGITVFSVDRLNALLHYANGVMKTGDWSYGLATLANQEIPFAKTFTSKMESRQGLLKRRAVQTMVQKYGPEELTEKIVGGFSVPTELTPFKERLSNAIFSGNTTDVQKRMDEFVAQAVAMGKSPEEAQKILAQAVVSLNPIQIGSSKMTEQQRAGFLAKLNPDQLKIEQTAEHNYEAAEGMVGRTTAITKGAAGGGYSAGGAAGIPGISGGTSTRSRGGSGVPGVPTTSSALSGGSGGRVRGSSSPRNRIRGRGSVRNTGRVRGMRAPRLSRPSSHYRSSTNRIRSHHKKVTA